ncbi:hypothetical protein F2Q69_00015381 [Brassica cretica]|uniref:PI31 proteasome regulator N-terminal domain-containing protein n=1 Tax=Brassica cretica TaxID=69181 RepID=A0A8S9QVL2_BRACR|nr:hypothetical protein F2Q69_00015381 [Brassica cretica]
MLGRRHQWSSGRIVLCHGLSSELGDPIDGWIHLGHSLPSRSLENLVILVTSLPRSQIVMLVIKSTRPRFRNNSDKVAFVVHATFVVSGYKLVAIGRHALAEDALASSPTRDEVAEGGTYPTAHLEIKVKRYAAKSRAEGDYYDAQFNNLDRLVTKLQNQILNKLD